MVDTIAKKDNKVSIEIIGGNAESVTGSCSIIKHNGYTSIFELGMIQDGKTVKENYDLNKKLISNIKNKTEIKYIFIGHGHSDHIGNIPALYKYDCNARIIVPKGSSRILKEMWLDSSYINQRDCEYLTDKFEKLYEPLYGDTEVLDALSHVDEYDFDEIIELDEYLKFRFIHAGHILFSAQTELFISVNNSTKKILFTSDLGNIKLNNNKVFVENFVPITKCNIVIGEATYSSSSRSMNKKDLQNDLNKIKSVITQYCVDNKKIVVIPTFSLDRLPYMLWILFSLFGEDKTFSVPIVVDSPLSIRLLNAYSESLTGEAKEKFDEMMNWSNLKFSYTPEESKSLLADGKSKCVLSSSGMLQAGRSVKWVQHVLPNPDDCILFIGFSTTNTLAYKIKHGKEQKTITINGKVVKNRAAIVDLHSFSSHMQHDDLLNYYSSINCEKIYLVHSNQDDKIQFKKELEKVISDKCKTTKVVAVNKSTIINL
jgi:metallo-beta-lactamase family protein